MDNPKLMKSAIRYRYNELSESIPTVDLIYNSFSSGLISLEEKQRIESEGRNYGQIAETKKFLDVILQKTNPEVVLFIRLLKENANVIYQELSRTVRAIQEGVITIGLKSEDLCTHLKQMYLEHSNWISVEPIPGELRVNVLNEALLMTPVFTAEKFVSKQNIPAGFVLMKDTFKQSSYDDITNVNQIDELFSISAENNHQSQFGNSKVRSDVNQNLIICAGNPGVGKTTLTHLLTLKWANGSSIHLSKYNAVFLIPLRDIKSGSLLDILKQFQFFPQKCEKENVEEYLSCLENARHTLFILDGADEIDVPEELCQLINGGLFPGATVFLTARPEAEVFKSRSFSKPMVKAVLHGTDEESVQRFISTTLGDSEEANLFYMTCKDTLTNIKMLCVPLYLTLMSFVLQDSLALNTRITDFKVPTTATEIFNAFLNVLVKRWLQRQGRNVEMNQSFSSCPLGKCSDIPNDIQRILYFVGKMCFSGLRKHKYEFTEEDMNEFYLDVKDIWNCGLFDKGMKQECDVYSLRHKQMQEYLAAAYLIEEENTHKLLSFLPWNNGCETEDALTLAEYCAKYNMIKTFQFMVGFSPDIMEKILTSPCHNHSVKKSPVDGCVDIYFEASLFKETNSVDTVNMITDHILQSKIVEAESGFTNYLETSSFYPGTPDQFQFGSYDTYQKSLQCFLQYINSKASMELLEKWYNIKLKHIDGNEYQLISPGEKRYWYRQFLPTKEDKTENCVKDELNVCMDQMSAVLLNKFLISNVTKLCVRSYHTVFLNLQLMKVNLPSLKELDVLGKHFITSESTDLKINKSLSSSLKSLTLTSNRHYSMLPSDVKYVLSQELLDSLTLIRLDMFTNMKASLSPKCDCLKEVIISDDRFNSCKLRGTCLLLKNAKCIQKLRLWCRFREIESDVSPLIESLQSDCRKLETFTLALHPQKYMKQVVLESIPNMVSVKHVSVHYNDIQLFVDDFVKGLCCSKMIDTLTLYDYNHNGICTGYSLPVHCRQQLLEKRIKVNIKTPERLINVEDTLKLFKDW